MNTIVTHLLDSATTTKNFKGKLAFSKLGLPPTLHLSASYLLTKTKSFGPDTFWIRRALDHKLELTINSYIFGLKFGLEEVRKAAPKLAKNQFLKNLLIPESDALLLQIPFDGDSLGFHKLLTQ